MDVGSNTEGLTDCGSVISTTDVSSSTGVEHTDEETEDDAAKVDVVPCEGAASADGGHIDKAPLDNDAPPDNEAQDSDDDTGNEAPSDCDAHP